jgi:hypothetical protein
MKLNKDTIQPNISYCIIIIITNVKAVVIWVEAHSIWISEFRYSCLPILKSRTRTDECCYIFWIISLDYFIVFFLLTVYLQLHNYTNFGPVVSCSYLHAILLKHKNSHSSFVYFTFPMSLNGLQKKIWEINSRFESS